MDTQRGNCCYSRNKRFDPLRSKIIEQHDPIIEFDAGIKLFDFGTFAKQSVDLVDTVTKDVFVT